MVDCISEIDLGTIESKWALLDAFKIAVAQFCDQSSTYRPIALHIPPTLRLLLGQEYAERETHAHLSGVTTMVGFLPLVVDDTLEPLIATASTGEPGKTMYPSFLLAEAYVSGGEALRARVTFVRPRTDDLRCG